MVATDSQLKKPVMDLQLLSTSMGVDSWIPALLLGKVWSFCMCDVDFGSVCNNNVGALLLLVEIWYVDDIGTFCCEVGNEGNTPACGWCKGWFKVQRWLCS